MSDAYIRRSAAIDLIRRHIGNLHTSREESLLVWVVGTLQTMPAADVASVVHGTPVTKIRTELLTGYHEEIGVFAADGSNLYRKNMVHTDIPYDHCPICGATLCSRWHNFCGKCGARMDGGDNHAAD